MEGLAGVYSCVIGGGCILLIGCVIGQISGREFKEGAVAGNKSHVHDAWRGWIADIGTENRQSVHQ